MATWTSGVNNGYSLRMNAYEIGVNQAANSSTVRIDLWLKVGTQSFYGPMFVEARCGGQKQNKTVQISGPGFNSEVYLGTWDFNYPHGADGKQVANVDAFVNAYSTAFAFTGELVVGNRQFALTDIPRASDPMGDYQGVLGQPITFTARRKSDQMYNTVWLRFGDVDTKIIDPMRDTATWTPPLDLASKFPQSNEGVGTLTLITYRNGTTIETGRSASQIRLRIPDTEKPIIKGINTEEQHAKCKELLKNLKYVRILSEIQVSLGNFETKYGATIPDDGMTVRLMQDAKVLREVVGKNVILNNINTSGKHILNVTIRDSRGLTSAAFEKVIQIDNYSPPVCSARVDRRNDDEKKLRLYLNGRTFALFDDQNRNVNAGRRTVTVKNTTTNTTVNDTSGNLVSLFGIHDSDRVLDLSADYSTGNSFSVYVAYEDAFGNKADQSLVVGTIKVHRTDDPFGIGINKVRERGALDIAGDVYVNNKKLSTHALTEDSGQAIVLAERYDVNNLLATGFYRCLRPTNIPAKDEWFYIRVISHNLSSYVFQEAYGYNGNWTGYRVKVGNIWQPWKSYEGEDTPVYYLENVPIGWGLKATFQKRGRIVTVDIAAIANPNVNVENAKLGERIPNGFKPMVNTQVVLYRNAGSTIITPALWSFNADGTIAHTESTSGGNRVYRGHASWIAESTAPATGGANAQIRR
jgi:putative uncharacterized protein SPs0551|nr:MAG TPA: protein of unknown function DUF859 [Caudoviricetes sp.]